MLRFMTILLILFLVLVAFLSYGAKQYQTIYGEQQQINPRPLDDLSAGKIFIQTVVSNSSIHTKKYELDGQLCVELLLATHGDRDNSGTVKLTLTLDGNQHHRNIDMREVADNVFHRVCFDDLLINDFIESEKIELIIAGVDGEPGSSITSWTTTDTRYGSFAQELPDDNVERSLVFRFGYLTEQPQAQKTQIIFLSVIYFLSILVLCWPFFRQHLLKTDN